MRPMRLLFLAVVLAVTAGPAVADWEVFLSPDQYTVSLMTVSPQGTWMLTGDDVQSFTRSVDGGTTWETTLTGWSGVTDICTAPDSVVVLACGIDGILRSTDDGATWEEPAGLPEGDYSCWAVARSPVTGTMLANVDETHEYGETSLYLSHDDGATWQPTSTVTFSDAGIHLIRALSDGTFLLADYSFGVQLSTDEGVTWEQAVDLEDDYYCLHEAPDGTLFLGTSTLYRSEDGGHTWELSDEGITPWLGKDKVGMNYVEAITASTQQGEMFLTYKMTGVFRSTDGGHTWARCDDDLNDTYDVTDVITAPDGNVYVAIYLGGIYRWTGDSTPAPAVQAGVRLLPAAPNPCNPRTVLRFDLPRAMSVTLDLLDAAGRRVRRLWDGPRPAGPQSLVCDGQNLASGVYYYRLAGPGWSRTGRFTLVR